ncbi:MAG: hypothetical protein N2442_01995 [Spirochaetes bacterium]|nr:hypothetical protein [Spirochaetota bacterium]
MEAITTQRRMEILISHSGGGELFWAGCITAVVSTVVVGLLSYLLFPSVALIYRIGANILLLGTTMIMGFVLRLEYTLSKRYRLSGGVPLYVVLMFLVWFGYALVLLIGAPTLAMGIVSKALVLPLVLVFIGALGYGFFTKKLFFFVLRNLSHPDYVSLHYREQIWEHLKPLWETVRRYKDPCTLALIRLNMTEQPVSILEILNYLESANRLVKNQLRLTDRNGIRSRDTLYVLLPNTDLEVSEIPLKRIQQALVSGGFQVEKIATTDLRNADTSPTELLSTLEGELRPAGAKV